MSAIQIISEATGLPLTGFALETGDVQISINGGEYTNLTNLPTTRREDSAIYDLDLTEAENVPGAEIRFRDQVDPNSNPVRVLEWRGPTITIDSSDVANSTEISALRSEVNKIQRGTSEVNGGDPVTKNLLVNGNVTETIVERVQ